MRNTSFITSIDVRRDFARNMHYIVIYSAYYDFVFRLKMAFIAETCCCRLITNKAVCRLDLYLFYLLVYLKNNGNTLPKKLRSGISHTFRELHLCSEPTNGHW